MKNCPTLRLALRHMLDHEFSENGTTSLDRDETETYATAEFERWLADGPEGVDEAETELAMLSPERLRQACTTEPGTVALEWYTDQVLEDISGCIYDGPDPGYSDEWMFTFGLFVGYYQSDYQEYDAFGYFHGQVPPIHEFAFFDGYLETRKYGAEAYEQGKAHYSEVMV